jgi:hypothetical protein
MLPAEIVALRGGGLEGEKKMRVRRAFAALMTFWAWRSMAAVALVVANIGLVQLAGVQPAQAATVTSSVLSEGFDGVTPPAVPAGWNAIRAEGRSSDQTWRTSTPGFTTDPNKASIRSYGHVTDMILESPAFVAGAATKLRFYKQGIMQATTGQFSGDNLDGVVLEIKIGTAGYVDFLAAGGTFNAGEGYNRRIASTQDNPLGGRMGWSGHQLGSSVTNATFPTSATGQTVRLRWRLGTSDHTANQGGLNFFQDQAFAIDSVQVTSEKTTQTITLTSIGPLRPPVGVTYTPTATASSGLPVTISIAPDSSSVCSISAGLITFNAPGTCEIQYTQDGDSVFAPAPMEKDFIAVRPAGDDQTISFTSTAPVNPPVGAKYRPTATATSGLDVVFSIAAGSSSVCSLKDFFEGPEITFNAIGSCVIQADQLGQSEVWKAAPQVTQTVDVVGAGPSLQTISFTSTAPVNPTVGATYTPTATATSGLPVTFSIAAGSSSVCSLGAANLVTFNTAGSCVILADQAGSPDVFGAPQVTQTVNVVTAGPASQTISFTSTAPVNPTVGATYTPTATATSGLPVTFSIASGSTSVCSLGAANLVTFNAVGSCVIQADQAGNAGYNAATRITQTVNVVAAPKVNQTISFTSTAPVNPPVGATYTPTATATSGLPVTFSIASGSTSVCSLGAANLVTFNAVGSCVIQADQAGNAGYNAATRITQTVNVVAAPKAPQTISFTSSAPSNPPVGATYTPTATASSGLPVSFSIAAGSSSVCSLGAANLVTFNATGSCVIQADQAGNATIAAALRVTQTVNVVKANQTINFPQPGARTVGDAPFTVSATASSGLPVSFSVPSGGPCTISGTTVTIIGPGTCSITANQAGNGNYNAAPVVTRNVAVAKASPTISGLASAGGPVGGSVHDVVTVAGGASPTGTVTFRLFANNTCTTQVFTSTNNLVGGTATSGSFPPAAPGTYYWTAVYNGDANNNPATAACGAPNQSVTITKASPTLSAQASAGGLLGAPVRDVATLSGGSTPTGTVTFRLFSDNTCSTQVFTSTNALSGLTAASNWFTPAVAGTYWWTALYNGDANNNTATSPCQAPNQSVVITPFQAPTYTRTVTGDVLGPVTVNAGDSVLITGARVQGAVTVNPGGALTVVNSSITGIVANAPGFFSLCGSGVAGPAPATALSVSNATVPIRVGDPATGCTRNRFAGQVSLTSNLAVTFGGNEVSHNATLDTNGPGNTIVKANTVFGSLGCTGNNPGPMNLGQPNTAGTKTGQCASL